MNRLAARLIAVVVTSLVFVLLPAVAQASFPGRNGRIAFQSDRSGSSEIWAMNPDGGGPVALTEAPSDGSPAWSPDGTKIAFSSSRDRDPQHPYQEIYVMNADGTGLTRLTTNAAQDSGPAWSPDARRIVFASNRDGVFHLYVMHADGTDQHRLTHSVEEETYAAWSPDGRKIAFDRGPNIYVMNADGSDQRMITHASSPDAAGGPNWSPDGRKIAFFFAGRPYCGGDIFVMNPDGSAMTQLTNPTPDSCMSSGNYPVWSPDGTKIAYMAAASSAPGAPPPQFFRNDNAEIFVMNADGSGRTNLTNNPADERYPAWQPLGPNRGDYKSASEFCKAERDFVGEDAFTQKYGDKHAFIKCVAVNGVHCGDVITRDTTLDTDLHCGSGTALLAAGHDLTLDLNRHTVEGDIQNVNPRQPANNNLITGGTIRGTVDISASQNVTVQNNLILPWPTEPGIRYGKAQVTLTGNSIRGGSTGIDQGHNGHATITGNRISRAAGHGLDIDHGTAVVSHNVFSGNGADGVRLAFALGTNVQYNILTGNRGNGIETSFGSYLLSRNSAWRNGGDGFDIGPFSSVLGSHNSTDRNGKDGIRIEDPIEVSTLSGNHGWFNRNLGIEAPPGTQGGGDSAKHNGNPTAQCVPASLCG